MMQPQHRWEANDIINIAIVIVLGIVMIMVVLMYGVLMFLGKIVPDITQTMFGGLLTGVSGGLIGYLARGMRNNMLAQPAPQVNMGDGSTTNVTPAQDQAPAQRTPPTGGSGVTQSGGTNGT